jgi:hypothetical protein
MNKIIEDLEIYKNKWILKLYLNVIFYAMIFENYIFIKNGI